MTHNTREVTENWRDKYKAMEQRWMHLKDQYAEIATALGFKGDAWFGDPLADHAEIVSKTRSIHHQLQKAREEERERCIKIVEDYGKSMSKLHSEMIGTAHEDSKMMLAFDMHSRLIAVKHITEKMNHSELDQDKK